MCYGPSMRHVSRPLLHGAAIAIVTFIAYSSALHGEFISDDITTIRDNPLIRSLDWAHVREIFRTFDGANYMPLKVLSLAIDYRVWGPAPFGFHVSNVVIHILCALVIYAIVRRLAFGACPALFVAVLWAVHPLQVESVAWISERKNVLSGLFFFAAFYVYLAYSEHGRARSYVAVLALYVLALLSKMNTMVLPAVCLAFEIAFRFRLRARDVLASVPMFALAGLVGWYNIAGNPIHGGDYEGGSAIVTWLSSSVVVYRYLGKLVWPAHLSSFYEVPLRGSVLNAPVLCAVLGLLALAGITVYCIVARRREGFWILWFGITLAPMLNIIPFRSMMNDRYMYLPMLGPLALAANGLAAAARAPRTRPVVAALASLAVLAYGGVAYRRGEVWASPLSLWRAWAVQNLYIPGDPIYRQAQFESKIAALRAVIGRDPSSVVAHNNVGALYYEAGRFDEAIGELETARRVGSDDAIVLLNLGRAYAHSARLADAVPILEHAAALAPYSFVHHLHLARVYLALGDASGARRALAACARLRPTIFASSPALKQERDALRRLHAAAEVGPGR
jgi:cytochrome c-type biogenesis protein CcmH/NrfG